MPILNKRYSRIYLLARTCAAYVSRITMDTRMESKGKDLVISRRIISNTFSQDISRQTAETVRRKFKITSYPFKPPLY